MNRNVLPGWLKSWEDFWFTPADPSLLALIRVACGAIVVYTLIAYSFTLQDFMGEHAWLDLDLRLMMARERPVQATSLNWNDAGRLPEPTTEFQSDYVKKYRKDWGFPPHPPYPKNWEEAQWLDEFRMTFGMDMRLNGAPIPQTEYEKYQAYSYTRAFGQPPPAFVKNDAELKEINDFMLKWNGHDPRRLHARGMPVWSIWFHVTDPAAMVVVHVLFIVVAILFTLGFCTRITAAITWFACLSYIHRNSSVLFGVDTMMNIVLIYLMIAPSGAVFSLDRVIARWWRSAKPDFVISWYRLWKMPVPPEIAPAADDAGEPSVAANVVIRLLQIHVGIIYLVAGLSKLLGTAWWNGTAIWATVANYEFAPMQNESYLAFIRFLGEHQWLHDLFLTGGGLFTLIFEISYIFLVWRPRLRWIFLGSAILLHGGIGLFMGLKTFALMMLVMNMAFLTPEEVRWVLGWFTWPLGSIVGADAARNEIAPTSAAQIPKQEAPTPSESVTASK